MLLICSLIAALTSIVQAPQTADGTGRIAGRVTVEGANTAVAGARIILLPSGRPTGPMGPPPQAITDQDGRFVFDRLAPGTYRVDAQKTGFVSPNQFGQRPPSVIEVAAGRETTIDLALQKGGVIAGRVLDPSGEPMTDISIMVLRRMPTAPGSQAPRLMPAGPGAQTNDLGEYRLAGVAAGEYYVAAMPRGRSPFGGPGVTPSSGTARTTIAATYYPGTADQAAALPIAVAAGAEVNNISFAMQSAVAFSISGVVVDENGDPVADAMVMLMGDPRSGMFMGPGGGARSQADGRFTIGEVAAGSYRVSASIPVRINEPGTSGGFVSFSSGGSGGVVGGTTGGIGGGIERPTEVVVADADVSGVRVVVRRPARQ